MLAAQQLGAGQYYCSCCEVILHMMDSSYTIKDLPFLIWIYPKMPSVTDFARKKCPKHNASCQALKIRAGSLQ